MSLRLFPILSLLPQQPTTNYQMHITRQTFYILNASLKVDLPNIYINIYFNLFFCYPKYSKISINHETLLLFEIDADKFYITWSLSLSLSINID